MFFDSHFHLVLIKQLWAKQGGQLICCQGYTQKVVSHPPTETQDFSISVEFPKKRPGNYLPDGESWFMGIHRVFLFHLKRVWYQDFRLPPSVIKHLTEINCLSLNHLITIMATTENLLYIEIKNTVELNELHWTKVEKSFRVIKEQR